MDETELIQTFISKLSAPLSVPVRTAAQEDDRPVPAIVIDDWSTKEMNFHNSPFAGDSLTDSDNDGNLEYERYLRFNFKTRLEFLIRHSDEVEASKLTDSVKEKFRPYTDNADRFHNDLLNFSVIQSGNPNYEFTEPKEVEEMIVVKVHGNHIMTFTPADLEGEQIDSVQEQFTFNPN